MYYFANHPKKKE